MSSLSLGCLPSDKVGRVTNPSDLRPKVQAFVRRFEYLFDPEDVKVVFSAVHNY